MTQSDPLPRRTFLIDTVRVAAAGWLAFELPFFTACARDNTNRDARLTHLTTAEARTLHAFAAQILPSESGRPGANEAGTVDFIDRALGMPFFAESAPIVRGGLAQLDARAAASGARDGFASLSSLPQIALMREIEQTPFFATARALVVTGVLADASYGGNRGGAAWALLGIEHRPSFTAPFGWYDAQAASHATAGAA